MKPVNLLRDIRQVSGPRSDAQHLVDRAAFIARMRRQVGITYVAPPAPARRAA